MNSAVRRRGVSAGLLVLVLAAWAASPASAVTFYKWTDQDGKVHYGDAPPKAYASSATRIDVDPGAHVAAPPARPAATPKAAPAAPVQPQPPDLLTQRRLTRDRLQRNLDAARERLDVAQKALAETLGPQEGESQVVQGAPLPEGSDVPQPQVGGRSNCRQVATPTGTRVFCPHLTPGEQYYERIDKLQAEVKLAEQAVEEAEQAYRRGVD